MTSPPFNNVSTDIMRFTSATSTSTTYFTKTVSPARKRAINKRSDKIEELLTAVEKHIGRLNEDGFDTIGRHVAHKLRGLSKETAILAENLIMNILSAAQLGTLNRSSKIVNDSSVIDQPLHNIQTLLTYTCSPPTQQCVQIREDLQQYENESSCHYGNSSLNECNFE